MSTFQKVRKSRKISISRSSILVNKPRRPKVNDNRIFTSSSIGVGVINKPIISYPFNNSEAIQHYPTVKPFSVDLPNISNGKDLRVKTLFQVSSDENFNNILIETTTSECNITPDVYYEAGTFLNTAAGGETIRGDISVPSNSGNVLLSTVVGGSVSGSNVSSGYDYSSNSSSNNIPSSSLRINTTYYIRAKFLSDEIEDSVWSDVVNFKLADVIKVADRRYLRHDSGMGTIMVWTDKQGVIHNTLVLDSIYRNNSLVWARSGYQNFEVAGMSKITPVVPTYNLYNGTTSINGVDTSILNQCTSESRFFGTTRTDAEVNAYANYVEDVNSSRYNTDCMMQYSQCNTTSYAAGWCRSKLVNGVGCDLPNIQTLGRVYLSAFVLDRMDPSPANDSRRLTYNSRVWYASGNCRSWASSVVSAGNQYAFIVGEQSLMTYSNRNYNRSVIPVMELN